MDLIFFKTAIALYLASSLSFLFLLLRSSSLNSPVGVWTALAGFACHTLSILHRAFFSGFFPLATAFDALSFFAWLITAMFLVMQYRHASPFFGAMATPMAAVLMIVGATLSYQVKEPLVPVFHSWWLPIHVTFALAGNSVFGIMALAGSMYVVQERFIKRKKLGRIHKLLPSLEVLDMINRRGLPVGFFFMTVGIVSGALWAGSAWGFYWSWDPKETWSLITWFAYAAMVHQRLVLGWRGKKAAIMAMIGFVLVMFTFVGVSILFTGHHSFRNPVFGAQAL